MLDFQTQQHKLLPLLATAYAYNFAGLALIDMVNEIMLEVKGGNYRRLIEVRFFNTSLIKRNSFLDGQVKHELKFKRYCIKTLNR